MSLVDHPPRNLAGYASSRKPLPTAPAPGPGPGPFAAPPSPTSQRLPSLPGVHGGQPYQQQPYQQQQYPPQPGALDRRRTSSSSAYGYDGAGGASLNGHPANTNPVSYQAHLNQQSNAQRRSLSSATVSSTSTGGQYPPARQNSNSGSSLARTASSRSGGAATSYVALMRKQKATVWSDRAQHEDARLVAQQRAAKMRAAAEVQNMNNRNAAGGASSGGVRSKILHHGALKTREYVQTGLHGGVPLRLSQNEIDEDDSDDEYAPASAGGGGPGVGPGAGPGSIGGVGPGSVGPGPGTTPTARHHSRADSARSSLGSAGRHSSLYSMGGAAGAAVQPAQTQSHAQSHARTRSSAGSTPPEPLHNDDDPTSTDQTPVPDHYRRQDYFAAAPLGLAGSANSVKRDDYAGGSPGSPVETSFGSLGSLPVRVKPASPEAAGEKLSEAELRRRGSVDERTTTMSGYKRLYIANPDA